MDVRVRAKQQLQLILTGSAYARDVVLDSFLAFGSSYVNIGVIMLYVRAVAVDSSALLLACSITTGALESPSLLLSYFMIRLALHNTIILIITRTSLKSLVINHTLNHFSTQVWADTTCSGRRPPLCLFWSRAHIYR